MRIVGWFLIDSLPAGIEHIRHERRWRCGPRCVNDVRDNGGERGRDGVGDDRPGRTPREDFDLARSVEDDITVLGKVLMRVYALVRKRKGESGEKNCSNFELIAIAARSQRTINVPLGP